jgi:hypothetical protein
LGHISFWSVLIVFICWLKTQEYSGENTQDLLHAVKEAGLRREHLVNRLQDRKAGKEFVGNVAQFVC